MLLDYIKSKFPNFKIYNFKDGEEALQQLSLKPQIIILDYYLNAKNSEAENGLDILKKVRKKDASIRIIMLSSQENPEVAANVIKYGAYEYIVKSESAPYRLENILKHLSEHLILDHKVIMHKLVMVLGTTAIIAFLITLAFYLS